MLRSMSKLPLVASVKILRPILTMNGEAKALQLCRELFTLGVQLGCSFGKPSLCNNVLVETVKEYFLKTSRYDAFMDFMAPLVEDNVNLVLHAFLCDFSRVRLIRIWQFCTGPPKSQRRLAKFRD